jgi:hypothetical protein
MHNNTKLLPYQGLNSVSPFAFLEKYIAETKHALKVFYPPLINKYSLSWFIVSLKNYRH